MKNVTLYPLIRCMYVRESCDLLLCVRELLFLTTIYIYIMYIYITRDVCLRFRRAGLIEATIYVKIACTFVGAQRHI